MRWATYSMAARGMSAARRKGPMVWKIFSCTSSATCDAIVRATVGVHWRSSKLGLKSCCKSRDSAGQVALDKLRARQWVSYEVQSDRTVDLNKAKATRTQAADSDQWAMWQVFTLS